MTTLAVALVALAVACFCVMHVTARVIDYRTRRETEKAFEAIKKELEDEILHGGNSARMVVLRQRMQEFLKK